MGEYAKYAGREIKIGTCEDMYYLRFNQRGLVSALPGNVNPKGDDALGIRFRFPWPDEDGKQPGSFEDYDRAMRVDGVEIPDGVEHYSVQFSAPNGYLASLPCPESKDAGWLRVIQGDNQPKPITIHRNGYGGAVKLVRQKLLADGRVVPVLMCGGCGAMWRVEDEDEIRKLAESFFTEGERLKNDARRPAEIGARILSYAKLERLTAVTA